MEAKKAILLVKRVLFSWRQDGYTAHSLLCIRNQMQQSHIHSVSVYLLRNLEILQFQNTISGREACFKVQSTNAQTIKVKIRLLLENSQHLF